ncbi:hypothetical protein T10_1329 [Trichinella papuae]|uniref:Uncharacterized protein n=1 Tax=Trichinella papuae TaxID=268474 RepID=A0A0V1MFL2_9BILA|nr:hypothetical protein T10_1329 [Trichinella papuae]
MARRNCSSLFFVWLYLTLKFCLERLLWKRWLHFTAIGSSIRLAEQFINTPLQSVLKLTKLTLSFSPTSFEIAFSDMATPAKRNRSDGQRDQQNLPGSGGESENMEIEQISQSEGGEFFKQIYMCPKSSILASMLSTPPLPRL